LLTLKGLLEIPYADLRHPSVSLWEATAAARHLRESGKKTINEHLLIAAIEIQRELVQKAIAKKRAPKSRHQRTRLAKNMLPPSESQQSTSNATDVMDWSVEVEPYSGETW
jgi:putative transposase